MHTPGPWHVVTGVCHTDHPETSADVLGPAHEFIANCGCHEAAIANAYAIAALPDLLAACQAASHALKSYGRGNTAQALAFEVARMADAAIAKATTRVSQTPETGSSLT